MIKPFVTGFGSITTKPTVLVKINTDQGLVAWGESAALPFPNYKSETVDTCMLVIKQYISPLILNRKISDATEINNILKVIKGNNLAKAGVETAAWMIDSIIKNQSLSELLGGARTKIKVGESIGIKNSITETVEEINLRLSQGFHRIKIKIRPGWDLELIKQIRKNYPNISLMVDANSSYTLGDLQLLKKLDLYDLDMIEQPLGDDDIIDHASLQKQLTTPICLDESILSVEDARKAIDIGACKIINIKPGRVGGLLESKRIHDLCKKKGIKTWVGGMLESGVGRVFNASVASLPGCSYPADMSPISFYYTDSITDNDFDVDNKGYVMVPKTVNSIIVNQTKIKKYTTDKIIIN